MIGHLEIVQADARPERPTPYEHETIGGWSRSR
jgi:hypothetical protein